MTGRPSTYSEALAEIICERIVEGDSLRDISASEGMPSKSTILKWLNEHAEFSAQYARAREAQGDEMDGLILETARNCTAETAQADRVRIDAYKWRAARLAPKKYGDRLSAEVSGPDGAPIQVEMDTVEIARRIAFTLARAEHEIQNRGED